MYMLYIIAHSKRVGMESTRTSLTNNQYFMVLLTLVVKMCELSFVLWICPLESRWKITEEKLNFHHLFTTYNSNETTRCQSLKSFPSKLAINLYELECLYIYWHWDMSSGCGSMRISQLDTHTQTWR